MFRSNKAMHNPGTVFMAVITLLVVTGSIAEADFCFGEPLNLGSTVNSSAHDGGWISADGLSIFFDSNRSGGYGDWDVWVTTRETVDGEWGAPVNLGLSVNTSAWDGVPSVSRDGLTLLLSSNRPGGSGDWDLWMTTRETKDHSWVAPVNLGPMVNSPSTDWSPYICPDGLELYFASTRAGGVGGYDLWMTTRTTPQDDWSPPVNLGPGINSSADEFTPSICCDGLCLFFCSLRPGGYGNRDIWVATRATRGDDWRTPVNLGPPLNSPSMDQTAILSADGGTVFFLSSRPGGYGGLDLMRVPLVPIVDFNGDGQVDGREVLTMTQHWGQDNLLCDIAPYAWGDGIVNVDDLKALAEYIGKEVYDPTLIAHWALDEAEGTVASDSVGTNDGIVMGAPVWQREGGKVGGALAFAGVDDYVGTPLVLNPADGPFSVSAWIKGGAPGQVIISQDEGTNWLVIDPVSGALMSELKSTGRFSKPLYSDALITDGDWHRIGFVWDGSNRSLHLDDHLVAEDTDLGLEGYDGGLNIGCGKDCAPGSFFCGLIDDVRIYKRAVHP